MHDFKLHDSDALDGTKGKWRPALVAGAQGGVETELELAVVSCPECGCPFGVGGDAGPIGASGQQEGKVRCPACGWEDTVKFSDWKAAPSRARFDSVKQEHKRNKAAVKARQDGEKLIQAARAQAEALVEKAKKT